MMPYTRDDKRFIPTLVSTLIAETLEASSRPTNLLAYQACLVHSTASSDDGESFAKYANQRRDVTPVIPPIGLT
ncbi:Hypothetical protein NTJ_14907 [Nesidiocoris tenuis]|uniref:Uncharacterized protein n=1 Tax=Nesidiocoris tenuis TaxID=355587 RepID=A0ABN7BCI8_9HEMI|nr:Hypothetical protein NTJ_14907 [Nesidiocoris tenuis]